MVQVVFFLNVDCLSVSCGSRAVPASGLILFVPYPVDPDAIKTTRKFFVVLFYCCKREPVR